ncbi:MAG: hypothetical protein RIT27_2396 [Pseudomonadota bacterium]|jgi:hypothetical protein
MNALQLEYEKDFYSWIYKNIDLLKQRKFSELDVDILIDELESMAKRDKRELTSHLMILIAHLLKWQFQSEQRSGSWRGSIYEQRIRITKQLDESPSLKNQLLEGIEIAYPDALKLAIKETGLPPKIFPKECFYSIEQF